MRTFDLIQQSIWHHKWLDIDRHILEINFFKFRSFRPKRLILGLKSYVSSLKKIGYVYVAKAKRNFLKKLNM